MPLRMARRSELSHIVSVILPPWLMTMPVLQSKPVNWKLCRGRHRSSCVEWRVDRYCQYGYGKCVQESGLEIAMLIQHFSL